MTVSEPCMHLSHLDLVNPWASMEAYYWILIRHLKNWAEHVADLQANSKSITNPHAGGAVPRVCVVAVQECLLTLLQGRQRLPRSEPRWGPPAAARVQPLAERCHQPCIGACDNASELAACPHPSTVCTFRPYTVTSTTDAQLSTLLPS